MKREQVKEIANAVLYEGYLLYPYRQSAIKNRQRWTIGLIYPRVYSEARGGIDPWSMQTECLVVGSATTTLEVMLRFLHIAARSSSSGERVDCREPGPLCGAAAWSLASRFADEPGEEGIEREIVVPGLSLGELLAHPHRAPFAFAGERRVEEPTGEILACESLQGAITIAALPLAAEHWKLTVRIENQTSGQEDLANPERAILRRAFVSAHTLLQVRHGAFLSLLDPPDALREAARECQNARTWPVLVGQEGETDGMLSSPVILYDYPQIAPESPGSLFDSTEIDEILTLRIMTLTEEEKEEIRRGDPRVREMISRVENLQPEAFMKLHGTIRSIKPVIEGDDESSEIGKEEPAWMTTVSGPDLLAMDGQER